MLCARHARWAIKTKPYLLQTAPQAPANPLPARLARPVHPQLAFGSPSYFFCSPSIPRQNNSPTYPLCLTVYILHQLHHFAFFSSHTKAQGRVKSLKLAT